MAGRIMAAPTTDDRFRIAAMKVADGTDTAATMDAIETATLTVADTGVTIAAIAGKLASPDFAWPHLSFLLKGWGHGCFPPIAK
jgi:hypothetical protein